MVQQGREKAIRVWMDKFQTVYPEVKYYDTIDGLMPETIIEHTYKEKLTSVVKPHMKDYSEGDHRVDRHKIASLYELTVAYCCPILPANGDPDGEVNPLNFEFAYFVAQFIIEAFIKRRGDKVDLFISDELNREHTSLLAISKVTDGMIFANAASWYLIEKFCLLRDSLITAR